MSQSTATQTVTSLTLAIAVLMSGIHSKDLALPLAGPEAHQKVDDSNQVVKVAPDLHHHSDNTVKIHPAGGDGHQTDTRSLRLLHRHKTQPAGNRLADRLRLWWELSALHSS